MNKIEVYCGIPPACNRCGEDAKLKIANLGNFCEDCTVFLVKNGMEELCEECNTPYIDIPYQEENFCSEGCLHEYRNRMQDAKIDQQEFTPDED